MERFGRKNLVCSQNMIKIQHRNNENDKNTNNLKELFQGHTNESLQNDVLIDEIY